MNRKSNRIILILFALALLSFMTGCTTTQKMMPASSEMVANKMVMDPPEINCCIEYNSTYNWSEGIDASCCVSASLPAACNECIVNETQRRAEYFHPNHDRYRPSLLERILSALPVILVVLTLLSLLILIADKITSVAKDSADGFLKYRWKKVLMIFVLSAVAVFLIFYVIIRIFG